MSSGERIATAHESEAGWEVEPVEGAIAAAVAVEVEGVCAELSDMDEKEDDFEEFDEEDFDDDFDDDFEEELEDEYEIEADDSVLGPEFSTTGPSTDEDDSDEDFEEVSDEDEEEEEEEEKDSD